MSITDQIDPSWQTANIFVLFNAFEKFCFPQCISDMSRVYFICVNVRQSYKYINIAIRLSKWTSATNAKQTERNNSESNRHFMIAVIVKGLL